MNSRRLTRGKKLVFLGAAVALSVTLFACSRSTPPPAANVTPTPFQTFAIKPAPSVASLSATTSGFFEDYYVILDATIKNDGAEGVVIVIASITQGDNISTKQVPISLPKGKSQVVRFVFPIKWKGGDWVPKITTEVP